MSDWLTIEELAKQEGITIDGARKRAQRGQYATKKDGRRTLYRIYTEDEAAAITDGKAEMSAQSAYLVAKAKKMQLDTEAAEVKLNREKMLLYDSIRTDTLSVIKYAGARLREQVDFLTDEQKQKYNAAINSAIADAVKRFTEYRNERAKKATPSENEIEKGYWEYDEKKTQEETAAAEAAEKERERNQTPQTIESFKMHALWEIRQYARDLLFTPPQGCKGWTVDHRTAQDWQAATGALEVELYKKTAWEETESREEIQAIAQEYKGRLDELALEMLTR
jgi:leucyl aminopeptidase